MEIGYKQLINLYYTALMTFLVFTFGKDLLQGLFSDICKELVLYVIFLFSIIVQTTYAYKHIMDIKQDNYPILALVSDFIDIGLSVYICAAIGSTYNTTDKYVEMTSYLHLSIPFLILAVNQFCWYLFVNEFNPAAIFRLLILFVGMFAVSISEAVCHSIWNLLIIITVQSIAMMILRVINKTPDWFATMVQPIWDNIVKNPKVKKLLSQTI